MLLGASCDSEALFVRRPSTYISVYLVERRADLKENSYVPDAKHWTVGDRHRQAVERCDVRVSA